MRIERIDTIEAFDALREGWEALERSDAYATLFTGWRWLRAYFPTARYRWFVLAAFENDALVAALPLSHAANPLIRELRLGGNPDADYTGMLALPRIEAAAVAAFAEAIVALGWDGFAARDVHDPRIGTLIAALERDNVVLESTSCNRCRSCALPADWATYLVACISAKTRVNLVRVERRLAEALPAFRISEPTAETIDAHVAAMLAVNHARWGGNARNAKRRRGVLFRNAFDRGILRMVIYWDGDRPIAGGACFVDDVRSTLGLYMIGFSPAYERWSPGRGIVGRAIRIAVESGYARFDFLRGDEPFKARFAPDVHAVMQYRLRRGVRGRLLAGTRPLVTALKLQIAGLVYGGRRTI